MRDQFQRNITYIRVSVTDRCNLRCRYCMPAAGILPRDPAEILSYEEIVRTLRMMAQLGVEKVRLTGGEPLVRKDLAGLVARIKEIPGIRQVTLTTNGVLLKENLPSLLAAGLDGVNLSLDTLDAARFQRITRKPVWGAVDSGMQALLASGLSHIKINVMPLQGVNETELLKLAALAKNRPIEVRFIELMPVGCADTSFLHGVPMTHVREALQEAFGFPRVLARGKLSGPAEVVSYDGWAGRVGFIDAMGHKFCHVCNRVRLTSEGFLKLCLASGEGLDIRALLRGGKEDAEILKRIRESVYRKPKEHHFVERGTEDARMMAQIGG